MPLEAELWTVTLSPPTVSLASASHMTKQQWGKEVDSTHKSQGKECGCIILLREDVGFRTIQINHSWLPLILGQTLSNMPGQSTFSVNIVHCSREQPQEFLWGCCVGVTLPSWWGPGMSWLPTLAVSQYPRREDCAVMHQMRWVPRKEGPSCRLQELLSAA